MKVLVVARTRMRGGVCVGAVSMEDGRSLRLLSRTGGHLPFDAPYQMGFAWEADFAPEWNLEPPHVEDARVWRGLRVDYVPDLPSYLSERVTTWRDGMEALFGGLLLRSARGRRRVSRAHGIPDRSTGFWRPDLPLRQVTHEGRVYFTHGEDEDQTTIPYVGMVKPPDVIEADVLTRVSLSRWFAPRDETEAMCWLQVSGVYLAERRHSPEP